MLSLSVLGPARAPAQQQSFGRKPRARARLAPPPGAAAASPRPPTSLGFANEVEQYVRSGLLSHEEAQRCSREQLEFLIRKRTGADRSPSASVAAAPAPAGTTPEQARLQAYVADGVLSPEEVASCSDQQLAFLIRKRTAANPVANSVVPAPSRSASPRANGSASPAAYSAPPPPAASWAAPSPPAGNGSPPPPPPGGVEMSAEQLELLREYLKAQEEQEALLQQQVESLKREVEALEATEQQADPSVVPFHAPPLTDGSPAAAGAWAGASQQASPAEPAAAEAPGGGGVSWAGVAVAGVVAAGLTAGIYLAPSPDEGVRSRPAAPVPKEAPVAERPSGPIPFGSQQPAAQPADTKASLPPPPPLPAPAAPAAVTPAPAAATKPAPAEEKKAAAPAAATAAAPAAATAAAPAAPAAPKPAPAEEKKEAEAAAAKPAAEQAAPLAAKVAEAPAAPAAPAAPKPEQRAAPAPAAPKPAPAPAAVAVARKEQEQKSAQRAAAEKVAAELAADLAKKQAAAAASQASSTPTISPAGVAGGLALVAAGALALPQGRAAARALLDRLRGEQALVKAAQAKYEGLKRAVDVQQGDFARLQEKLAGAQSEYVRALAALKTTARELESLFGRVQDSERTAAALVSDLERFGANEAKQLKTDAARVAASVASQRAAVERALAQALKDL